MATFSAYTNTLPDPNNAIAETGAATGNVKGPGYRAVKLSSEHKIMNTRTNSGRLISRELSGHKWNISISYNPMTREEFEPINTFILQQRGSMTPFFVSLPQYKEPRDSTFATFVANSGSPLTFTTLSSAAGLTSLMITNAGYTTSNGSCKPGDVFTITDSSDSNHTKTYQITRVETEDIYLAGSTAPDANSQRITFIPALQRAVSSSAVVVLNDPKFRVVLFNDITEHDLDTNNLYSFSLKLEEAQA
jgi:hypothetical protein